MNDAFHTEVIEHAGQTVRVEYFYDDTCRGAPWAEFDGNVNIYDAPTHGRYSRSKKPSEVYIFNSRGYSYAYDIREAHKKARAESWCTGCEWAKGLTPKQVAARAVAENVEFWRGWLNDEWHYAGVVCALLDDEGEETEVTDSCWGFETFNDYHETAGREMAEALADRANKEAQARDYWACRDVQTVGAFV